MVSHSFSWFFFRFCFGPKVFSVFFIFGEFRTLRLPELASSSDIALNAVLSLLLELSRRTSNHFHTRGYFVKHPLPSPFAQNFQNEKEKKLWLTKAKKRQQENVSRVLSDLSEVYFTFYIVIYCKYSPSPSKVEEELPSPPFHLLPLCAFLQLSQQLVFM